MVVILVAAVLIVLPALAFLGTFLHDVPYVGLATAYVPWYLPWLITLAVLGGAAATYKWLRRRGRAAAILVVVAILTVAGGSVITARMTATVQRAGADIDLVKTFGIAQPESAEPDAEATYSTFEGAPLELSIYRPASSPKSGAPVLVFIHGGGWVAGDRSANSADLRWFADQGWVAVSVGYALSSPDRHLWDVTQSQIGCALAWLGDHIHSYGGDPTRLSLSGDSAGGNLAINAAYMSADGTLPSSCGGKAPPARAVSTLYPVVDPAEFYDNPDPVLGGHARGMVGAYTGGSPREFPQRYASIASDEHISAKAPPTLMILGGADHLVPNGGAYRFAERARAAGVEVELVTVPYADHVFDARPGSLGQQAFRQLTAQWLRDHGQAP
jgi:acetyl esterase/lipase